MNTPRGYNPVGQSAPGLPRHDAPLPGHVPGEYVPSGGDSTAGGLNTHYTGPGLGDRFGTWSARVFMAFATYLTLPMQLVLYPIAAIPAVIVGYFIFHWGIAVAIGYDTAMYWTWTCAWLVLLPSIRFETGIESQIPGYRGLRHAFRVVAFTGWFYYFAINDQMDPPQVALVIALIVAIPIHFILRSRLLRGMWDAFQMLSWLRKSI